MENTLTTDLQGKPYEKLDFTDDFLFCKILTENEDLCMELAGLITGRKVKEILRKETQKTIRLTKKGKGVRFDVYFVDDEGTVHDIEMQTTDTGNLPLRARYYQAMADLDRLKRGDDYRSLKETYVIFICTFDPFGAGRCKYSFGKTACAEDASVMLDDKTRVIFLNASGDTDGCQPELKEFLSFVSTGKASGSLTERLEEEVEKARLQEEWRREYMLLQDKLREKLEQGLAKGEEKGIAKGRAEGRAEGLAEGEAIRREQEARIAALTAQLEALGVRPA